MIWSIMPEDLLWGPAEEQTSATINYLGRQIYLRNGRLEQLLSTDPNDFLDQRFSPGALINTSHY